MKRSLLMLIGACLLAPPVWADRSVEALGLFKNRALLRVVGQDHYLQVGETTPEGATLLEADAEHAVVKFRDETFTLTLTDRVGGSFAAAQNASVAITPDRTGQYRIGGSINGSYVDFLVDTGASVVAISSARARALGIQYLNSRQHSTVVTAQGEANSYIVTLAEVDVGGIRAQDVQAAVIEGSYPIDVLLGMSYLRHVQMRENAGVLTLERKY